MREVWGDAGHFGIDSFRNDGCDRGEGANGSPPVCANVDRLLPRWCLQLLGQSLPLFIQALVYSLPRG